jgi:hypothetical protein
MAHGGPASALGSATLGVFLAAYHIPATTLYTHQQRHHRHHHHHQACDSRSLIIYHDSSSFWCEIRCRALPIAHTMPSRPFPTSISLRTPKPWSTSDRRLISAINREPLGSLSIGSWIRLVTRIPIMSASPVALRRTVVGGQWQCKWSRVLGPPPSFPQLHLCDCSYNDW